MIRAWYDESIKRKRTQRTGGVKSMKRTRTAGLRTASSIFALMLILNASGCAGLSGAPGWTSAAQPSSPTASEASTVAGRTETAAPPDKAGAKEPETTVPPDGAGGADLSPAGATGVAQPAAGENDAPASESQFPSLSVICRDGTAVAEIPSAAGGYTLIIPQPDGTAQSVIACGSDPLTDLAQGEEEIPYVEYGGQIVLSFDGGAQPDSVALTDIILRKDGTAQYDERTFIQTNLECRDGVAEFTLEVNPTVYLSSTMNPEGFYRGFRVTCDWDNGSQREYAFILRAGTCFPIESTPES